VYLPTQIELRRLDRLLPFARNSQTHSDGQIAAGAASIREFGWTNPVLTGPDDVIIAGHARLLAARKLGMEEVPEPLAPYEEKTGRRVAGIEIHRTGGVISVVRIIHEPEVGG
jgi:ParB-like chromosome segregation protein Spo0J